MRVVKRLAIASMLLAVASFPLGAAEREAPLQEGAAQAVSEAECVIGPRNQQNIDVWKDPSLTRSGIVLPDGKVALPMVGEIIAAGKTVA